MPAEGGLPHEYPLSPMERAERALSNFEQFRLWLHRRKARLQKLSDEISEHEDRAFRVETDRLVRAWIAEQLSHHERYDAIIKTCNTSTMRKGSPGYPELESRPGWIFVNAGSALYIEAAHSWSGLYNEQSLKDSADRICVLSLQGYEELHEALYYPTSPCLYIQAGRPNAGARVVLVNDKSAKIEARFKSVKVPNGKHYRIYYLRHKEVGVAVDFSDPGTFKLFRGISTQIIINDVIKNRKIPEPHEVIRHVNTILDAPLRPMPPQSIDNSLEIG